MELYMMKTLDGFQKLNIEEANKKYGEAEFPYHEDRDDDLCLALECDCGCIYEYDPNYVDCPFCEGDRRKEDTGRGLYVYREAKTIRIKVSGYNSNEGSREFEILTRATLEAKIDNLSESEIFGKTFAKANGMSHSGTAYTYIDARTGEIKTSWLGSNSFNHPWDSFYEIWLCTLKTGCGCIDLNTAEMLLSDTECDEFREFDGSIEDFILKKFGQKELDDRIETAIDWMAQEFYFDQENIQDQLRELYSHLTVE